MASWGFFRSEFLLPRLSLRPPTVSPRLTAFPFPKSPLFYPLPITVQAYHAHNPFSFVELPMPCPLQLKEPITQQAWLIPDLLPKGELVLPRWPRPASASRTWLLPWVADFSHKTP